MKTALMKEIKKVNYFRKHNIASYYLDLDNYILKNLNKEIYFVDLIKKIKTFSKIWDEKFETFSIVERKCTKDSLPYILMKMNYKFSIKKIVSKSGNEIDYYIIEKIKRLKDEHTRKCV